MILLLREPITRQLVALQIPGENHLFPIFRRNGWQPQDEQSRAIARYLITQEEERADHDA